MSHSQRNRAQFSPLRTLLCTGSSLSMLALSQAALAQDSGDTEVVVTGIRQVIQDSIVLKRQATTVVDGLSADEIGDLPALSIAEALEQIASVGSQREGSGATEVSIRGLGPFLGSTVINGREATNGSGDRSVNFSQFPSELFNKIEVHKTQSAELIEGGVAGQIALSTLKPLEYGKRRVQLQAKGSVQPDNLRINDAEQQLGYRLTGSYVDQWESNSIGEFGLSIGGQIQRRSNSEQEVRTGGPDACVVAANVGLDSEVGLDGSSCDATGFNAEAQDINPETGLRFGVGNDFVLSSSSGAFRQNITDDQRDSVFAAAQWRPNDRLDINLDLQYSDRTFEESRSDLIIDRNDIEEAGTGQTLPIDGFDLEFAESGAFRTATTSGTIEVNSQFSERSEQYLGFGGNVAYDVTDRLTFSVDGGYSDTDRVEEQFQARVRTGNSVLAGIETVGDGTGGFRFTVLNADVNDPSIFNNDDPRVREDLNQLRNDTIWSVKGDAVYDVDNGLISALKAGVRYSSRDFDTTPRVRNEFDADNDGGAVFDEFFVQEIDGQPVDIDTVGVAAATFCANDDFPEPSFLDGEISGNLITNIDSDGNVIEAGTGRTFLTFDGLCLGETLLGRELVAPNPEDIDIDDLLDTVDITEDTLALYGQVDFNTEFSGLPLRGNVGLRYVNTDLTSRGFRSTLDLVMDANGNITDVISGGDDALEEISADNSYTELLPSLNAVLDISDDVLIRGGVFRAISRPDPDDFGLGRDFTINSQDEDGEAFTSLADFISDVDANGNPFLEPFTSWNYDIAAEWYPNDDSIVAVGAYYKVFNGGFATAVQNEEFIIDGVALDVPVGILQIADETNTIFGIETTVSHAFTYLPGVLSGLGFNASYNYADSDFESEDPTFGESVELDDDGNVVQTFTGFVAPANLEGLSTHTANGRVYWNIGKATLTGIGKYRSEFFQPFSNILDGNRFISGAFVLDARLSYKVNKQIKLSVEGTNLLNTAREQTRIVTDNFSELNVFGPRVFLGLTAKF